MDRIDDMLFASPETSIEHYGEMAYFMSHVAVLKGYYMWLALCWESYCKKGV